MCSRTQCGRLLPQHQWRPCTHYGRALCCLCPPSHGCPLRKQFAPTVQKQGQGLKLRMPAGTPLPAPQRMHEHLPPCHWTPHWPAGPPEAPAAPALALREPGMGEPPASPCHRTTHSGGVSEPHWRSLLRERKAQASSFWPRASPSSSISLLCPFTDNSELPEGPQTCKAVRGGGLTPQTCKAVREGGLTPRPAKQSPRRVQGHALLCRAPPLPACSPFLCPSLPCLGPRPEPPRLEPAAPPTGCPPSPPVLP